MISNKILVRFYVEEGCSQDEGEASVEWAPINFFIYSDLFPDLIREAVDEWLDKNIIRNGTRYEVVFAHVRELDGAGYLTSEYFEPVLEEQQDW